MKERPILFSSPMVKALLAGTKTQTRRLVKPQPRWSPEWGTAAGGSGAWIYGNEKDTGDQWWVKFDEDHQQRACTEEAYGWGARSGCPYGVAGDRLWVREAWGFDFGVRGDFRPQLGRRDLSGMDLLEHTLYLADGGEAPRWRPSIHMPRWASRITLEVTEVRVQRLQDISEEDCWAEGIEEVDGTFSNAEICQRAKDIGACIDDARPSFSLLWDKINGKRAPWNSNPFLWCVSFRRLP